MSRGKHRPGAADFARLAALSRCSTCERPEPVCVCDRTPKLETRLSVLVLQHPREQDRDLGSAQLLAASLPRCVVAAGLSWRSLEQALGREIDARRWAVVFPYKGEEQQLTRGEHRLMGRGEAPVRAKDLQGLVLLDGSWSQAKTLWWRNPWLVRLPRVALSPTEPSIYGSVRREPRNAYLSTLEAAAEALVFLGEPEAVRTELRRVFRVMVQRARDALAATSSLGA